MDYLLFLKKSSSFKNLCWYLLYMGFSQWLSSKESTCNAGDVSSIPESRRTPGVGNGNPLQYSCLEIPRTEDPGGLQRVRHNSETEHGDALLHTMLFSQTVLYSVIFPWLKLHLVLFYTRLLNGDRKGLYYWRTMDTQTQPRGHKRCLQRPPILATFLFWQLHAPSFRSGRQNGNKTGENPRCP